MSSYMKGKQEVCAWITENFMKGSTALDVGAGEGIYWNFLHEWLTMDAVEIFRPTIEQHHLNEKYRQVMCGDIKDTVYVHYDLVIMGDVLEHMEVKDAQKAVNFAKKHSDCIIVAVPFRYKQGALYGNPWEEHKQDDLTDELFHQRFKGFKALWLDSNYGYYVWRAKNDN